MRCRPALRQHLETVVLLLVSVAVDVLHQMLHGCGAAAVIATGSKKNSARRVLEVYHVTDRDEGHDDGDDEEGVRVITSRTAIGSINAIAEKRPWFAEPRRFFFGFVTVRCYDYYWGFTAAQIELMMADLPLIIYPKSKDKKQAGSDSKHGFTTGTRIGNDEYAKELEAWKERIKHKPKGIQLKGFNIGFNTKIGD